MGVDEVGRGPLAGPVVAASVILPADHTVDGLDDSKRLTEKQRERLFEEIHKQASAIGVGMVCAAEIDRLNILQASLKAMSLSYTQLRQRTQLIPDLVLVDGNQRFACDIPLIPVIKGDQRSQNIAAASIVAKVLRDRIMMSFHDLYPVYDFASHKGYPTLSHRQALATWGASPLHRFSFRGVLSTNESCCEECCEDEEDSDLTTEESSLSDPMPGNIR